MLKTGQKITVETYDHKTLECRVFEIQDKTALICSEKEWQNAARQKREPDCVGWPVNQVREISVPI